MILKGRRKILSEYKAEQMDEVGAVMSVLNSTRPLHLLNKAEIDYLVNYSHGMQPILNKVKTVRDEINNTLVVNHAQMITRMVNGYFLGTPIQYIQNGDTSKKKAIDELNKYVAYEDKSSVDKEIGEYQSICGTAYRIIYTDGIFADEVPFEDKALNPATTYVVYENTIAEKPIMGVTYHDLLDEKGTRTGIKIYAYTNFGVYTFVGTPSGTVRVEGLQGFDPHSVGGVPVIEYPNNIWRIGDWELCIGLMDAINGLQSGRLDDIDQIVQSLLVFINADIDSELYDEMRERGVVMLKNITGMPTGVDSINNPLDQTGMSMFAKELESILYALIGIPDRNNRAGGGGDTGQAVELRDGWADLEILARNKELVFKKSEKQTLRIILHILDNKLALGLKLSDVDIKFSRNKNNNLVVKTQGYSILLATKTLTPADCLTIVDLVSDVNQFIDRGQAFWGDEFGGKMAEKPVEETEIKETETEVPVEKED